MLQLDRITFAPNVYGGKAYARGTRITAALIVNLVANGMSVDEIIADYPDLKAEDVKHALHDAAWAARGAIHLPGE